MIPVMYHRVRYHETDAQGCMFNSRYLEVADVAMTEFFRSLGYPYGDLIGLGADPSVLRANVYFRRPVVFDQVIEVRGRCSHVGTSSFALDFEFLVEGVCATTIELTYVNVDTAASTSRPLPDEIARALRNAAEVSDSPGG